MARGRKSKYDPILDSFLASRTDTVKVESDIEVEKLRTGLAARVKTREVDVKIISRGNDVYLERRHPLLPREEVRAKLEAISEMVGELLRQEWR